MLCLEHVPVIGTPVVAVVDLTKEEALAAKEAVQVD
jgi:hypothetical protein